MKNLYFLCLLLLTIPLHPSERSLLESQEEESNKMVKMFKQRIKFKDDLAIDPSPLTEQEIKNFEKESQMRTSSYQEAYAYSQWNNYFNLMLKKVKQQSNKKTEKTSISPKQRVSAQSPKKGTNQSSGISGSKSPSHKNKKKSGTKPNKRQEKNRKDEDVFKEFAQKAEGESNKISELKEIIDQFLDRKCFSIPFKNYSQKVIEASCKLVRNESTNLFDGDLKEHSFSDATIVIDETKSLLEELKKSHSKETKEGKKRTIKNLVKQFEEDFEIMNSKYNFAWKSSIQYHNELLKETSYRLDREELLVKILKTSEKNQYERDIKQHFLNEAKKKIQKSQVKEATNPEKDDMINELKNCLNSAESFLNKQTERLEEQNDTNHKNGCVESLSCQKEILKQEIVSLTKENNILEENIQKDTKTLNQQEKARNLKFLMEKEISTLDRQIKNIEQRIGGYRSMLEENNKKIIHAQNELASL